MPNANGNNENGVRNTIARRTSGDTPKLSTGYNDVDHLFLYFKCNKTVSFRPKGGELYVFRPDDPVEINDWVSDGHVFM